MAWHGPVRSGVIGWSVVRSGVATHFHTVWPGLARYSVVACRVVVLGRVWLLTFLRWGNVRSGVGRYGDVWFGYPFSFGSVWRGEVCYGLVW